MSHDGTERRATPLTDEQLRLIGQETERATKKAVAHWARRAAVGFLALLVGVALAGLGYLNALEDGLKGSCYRVNVLRAQSNVSDNVSFNILVASAGREQALVKGDPDNAALHRNNANRLYSEAGRLTVTGMTDCEAAVEDPEDYVRPVADPIGDPREGRLGPGVSDILADSEALLRQEEARQDG